MPSKPADAFRRNVSTLLAERDMTMTELSLLTGIARPNISRILAGSEQVTLDRAGRIAKALKIDLADLLANQQKFSELVLT